MISPKMTFVSNKQKSHPSHMNIVFINFSDILKRQIHYKGLRIIYKLLLLRTGNYYMGYTIVM